MTAPPDLSKLSHADKDRLIQSLTAQLAEAQATIAAQEARITALEARIETLTRPPKTPANSSKPPSQGQKPNRRPVPLARLARAGPVWAGRCIRTRIEWSKPG